ncbi:hypothetical protein LOZ80_31585 [Paenibacillus sp. HWE-109]|uniref:hypothetical protein n=1 Tax=Paenibacillus sp. HWE-109 TaxID=1306526 RepID=UPI001EDD4D45|nr:hypothetical protein [Paenibacillus sp. HWE-109]UKS26047.1 hypothetical protein LOZ80_31585 [Paenibacillus sp. HWE-109]
MIKKPIIEEQTYTDHRNIATQLESVYQEINKLATKKPTEKITAMISNKINHLIIKVKSVVTSDEFLDAIETVPVEGNLIRLDETLILLGELRGIMDKQWGSENFKEFRNYHSRRHDNQVLR